MGKNFVINVLGILLASYIIWWTFDYNKQSQEEFANLHLSQAIEHSSKAAANELLSSRDTDIDYENYNQVSADPEMALEVFVDVFLKNMGMSMSEENRHLVRTKYMPVFVVALTDGFYIAKHTKIKGANNSTATEYDLVFSPKLAYSYKNAGKTYSLIQGAQFYSEIKSGGDVERITGLPPNIADKRQVHEIIGKNITSAMKSAIDSYQEIDKAGWSSNFYLPSELTSNSRVNAIDGPTVITLFQGVDVHSYTPIDTYSITGNKIKGARMIVAYRRNGIKYYSYHDKAPAGITIDQPYSTMYEAAINGYMADIESLK